ncbi:MAG: hypothetical protein ACREC5_08640, partial [Thermoplasmata archaeon]
MVLLGAGGALVLAPTGPPGSPAEVPIFLPVTGSPTYQVSGTLTAEPSGAAIGSASVSLYSVTSCSGYAFPSTSVCGVQNSTRTAANGAFSIGAPSGRYYLVADNTTSWG